MKALNDINIQAPLLLYSYIFELYWLWPDTSPQTILDSVLNWMPYPLSSASPRDVTPLFDMNSPIRNSVGL